MRLDPGQAKKGQQEPQNKETSTFTTATNGKDEKTRNAKSEGTPTLANTPKTFPQSTPNTPKLKEDGVKNDDEVKNSKLKEDEVKNSKLKKYEVKNSNLEEDLEVKNSTDGEFLEEHLSHVAETPVTVYYVCKLLSWYKVTKSISLMQSDQPVHGIL